MYDPLELVTGDVFTEARAAAFETQFEEGVDQTVTAPSIAAGTLTLDLDLSRVFNVALNASVTTLAFSNVPASRLIIVTLILTADGTPRTVTFPASVRLASAIAYSPTSTNNKRDWLSFHTINGGTAWDLFICGQNF